MLKELKTGELQNQKNNLSFDEFGGFDDVDSLVTFDDTEFEVENIKNRDLRKLGSVARGPVLKQINDAPEIVIVPDKNDDNKLKQMLKIKKEGKVLE